ncbi:MAG: hypothetical protein U9R39_03220 [Campylobacterota bacterium]|nr:hypothetical protein [Campylobacterota bacterium]
MYLQKIMKIIFLSIIIIFFSACVPKDVEVYEQNDQLLNCNQLTTEIADLIDANTDINDTTGLSAESIAKWYIYVPLGGYNQYRASTARDSIDERLKYLISLKKQQNCTFSHREIAFNKYKGRASEDIEKMKKEYDKGNK